MSGSNYFDFFQNGFVQPVSCAVSMQQKRDIVLTGGSTFMIKNCDSFYSAL